MRRARLPLAAAALLSLLPAAGPGAPAGADEESVAQVLESAERFASVLRDTVPLFDRRPDPPTLDAAADDARRAVAEIDRLSANAAIFQSAPADRQKLQDLAAESHLRLALYETYALELDRARQEIARARALSDIVDGPDYRTEWSAHQTGQPGRALLTRWNLLTVPEFEAALGSISWRARPVPFEFRGVTTQDLSQVRLTAVAPPPIGSLDERLLLRGTALARAALERGQSAFTAPLPPGAYRLQGRPGGEIERTFVVPEATDADAVLVDRARFSLRLDPKPGPRPPRFFLNGVEVASLESMPYGVYRLKADPDEYPSAPLVVTFVLGDGIPDKTRTSWTIYVPAGGGTVLALDRGAAGRRR